MKMLVFDMDGVCADLYSVPNWERQLRAESVCPYLIAKPLVDMEELRGLLITFKSRGWRVAVTSWCSKDASRGYDKEVARAKKQWLDRYSFPYDETHFLKYGRTKANATRKHGGYQVLIDDNAKIRAGWRLGATIDGSKNFIEVLQNLLTND